MNIRNKMRVSSILWALVALIALIVVTLSIVLFANFKKIVLEYIYVAEKNSVLQTAHTATTMTDMVAAYATQMYADPSIYDLLRKQTLTSTEQLDGLTQLFAFRSSSSSRFIHSIYVYNEIQGKVYIASSNMYYRRIYDIDTFFDQEFVNMIKGKPGTFAQSPVARCVPVHGYGNEEPRTANVYTFVFSDMPLGTHPVGSALVINVSEQWINDSIDSMETKPDYSMIVVDEAGKIVASNKTTDFLCDLSEEAYIQRILDTTQEKNYFIEKVSGRDALVIYAQHPTLGWYFIRTLPYDNILKEVNQAQISTVIICLATLLVGVSGSFFLFRWLRKPLDQAVDRLDTLEHQNQLSQYPLKQDYLRRVVWDSSIETQDVINKLISFGIMWDLEKMYCPVLFLIDDFAEVRNRYNVEQRINLKRRIINDAYVRFSRPENVIFIDMLEDGLLAILVSSEEYQPDKMAQDIQEQVSSTMDFTVSAMIGDKIMLPCQLCDEYRALAELGNYRTFYGYGCVLVLEEAKRRSQVAYSYPKDCEDKLVQALYQAHFEEAEKIYLQMAEQACKASYRQYENTLLRISFSVFTAVGNMEKYRSPFEEWQVGSFITELEKLELQKEIDEHFHGLFVKIEQWQSHKKRAKTDDLRQQIELAVQRKYGDPALSVEAMADALGLSSVYFGRLFKKIYGKSFLNYVTEVRMENAKDLLTRTNMPNEQIAEKVGYTNVTYYYKVFKRYSGVTPFEYRTKYKCSTQKLE